MIVVRDLGKTFDGVAALSGVSLALEDRACLCVTGPSGGGKTTLLRLIAGLDAPSTGRIEIDGRVASAATVLVPPHQRATSMMFQASALWPHMTLAANIRFAVSDRPRREADATVKLLLDRTGISDVGHRYPHQVSGGQARRAALARALAPRRRHLLLDEPTTNVDPDARNRMATLIREWADETQAAVIVVTHDLDEAVSLGGRQARIVGGKLAEG
jgi:iron(III) transport system ATP-binding protein